MNLIKKNKNENEPFFQGGVIYPFVVVINGHREHLQQNVYTKIIHPHSTQMLTKKRKGNKATFLALCWPITNLSRPLQISLGVGKLFPKLEPPQAFLSPASPVPGGTEARMTLTPGAKGGPGGVCTASPLPGGGDGGQFSGGSAPLAYDLKLSQKDTLSPLLLVLGSESAPPLLLPFREEWDFLLLSELLVLVALRLEEEEEEEVVVLVSLPISTKVPWRGAIWWGRK